MIEILAAVAAVMQLMFVVQAWRWSRRIRAVAYQHDRRLLEAEAKVAQLIATYVDREANDAPDVAGTEEFMTTFEEPPYPLDDPDFQPEPD